MSVSKASRYRRILGLMQIYDGSDLGDLCYFPLLCAWRIGAWTVWCRTLFSLLSGLSCTYCICVDNSNHSPNNVYS